MIEAMKSFAVFETTVRQLKQQQPFLKESGVLRTGRDGRILGDDLRRGVSVLP
jgi:hypothetical protein